MRRFGTHRELEERRRYEDPSDCDGHMVVVDRTGQIWTVECDRCGFTSGLPMANADPEQWGAQLAEHRRSRSGVPRALRDLVLPDDASARSRALRNWATGREQGVLLTGPVGIGKTYLAAAAAWRRLAVEPVRWLSVPVVFAKLALAFDDAERHEMLRVLSGEQAIVLDDLDKTRPSEYAAEQLFCAIDARVTGGGALLTTTNLKLRALAERYPQPFGQSIASRLAGYCQAFALDGDDRRVPAPTTQTQEDAGR